jgi:hypothetical protein
MKFLLRLLLCFWLKGWGITNLNSENRNHMKNRNSNGTTAKYSPYSKDRLVNESGMLVSTVNYTFRTPDKGQDKSVLSIYGSTALCWTLAAFSVSWSVTQSVGLLGWGISPSQGRFPAHRTARTQNKRTQTSMSQVGFLRPCGLCERSKRKLSCIYKHVMMTYTCVQTFVRVYVHIYVCM